MAMPPKDISPSKLWVMLSSIERPSKVVDFPRWDADYNAIGQMRIRVLTQEEQMACSSAAEDVARKLIKDGRKGDIGYERLFTDALIIETLFRACRDLDDLERPAFPTPTEMRRALTTEECAALFEHYLTVQLELGPSAKSMSDDELEAWIDRLAEGGSAFPFALLSMEQQQIVLLYMAYLLRPAPRDSSSPGTSQDTSTTTDSDDEPKKLSTTPSTAD